jgi:ribonuclease P protein component
MGLRLDFPGISPGNADQPRVHMNRLKSRPQFQAVLAGETIAKTSHFAMHRTSTESAPGAASVLLFTSGIWLGAMVPKRWAKRAVTRNAIKRQIYAVSAGLETQFPKAAFLVRLKQEFSRKAFPGASSPALKAAVRVELVELLQRGLTAA